MAARHRDAPVLPRSSRVTAAGASSLRPCYVKAMVSLSAAYDPSSQITLGHATAVMGPGRSHGPERLTVLLAKTITGTESVGA